MRELREMEDRDEEDKYFTARMTDLPEEKADTPLKVCWSSLKTLTRFRTDGVGTTEFTRGVLKSSLAKQLYGSPSEELINQAAKSMVWVQDLKASVGLEVVATVKKWATDLQTEVERLKAKFGEVE
ncbi:hypothetical protein GW17_00039760 [Ensete ventricosum]|nr:hypothetical protein GW17_00039760 [Ensete ventricosum]